MPDVIIKDMKMPENCYDCLFAKTNDDLLSDDYRYMYCDFPQIGAFVTDYIVTRHPDCPLSPAPEWISVEERLPEDNEAVNITWINRSPVIYYQDIKDKPQSATGVYYKGQWYWWSAVVQDYLAEYGKWDCDKMDDAIEVTHWMPLPEPPEGGDHDAAD